MAPSRPSILYKYVDRKTAWESLESSTLAFTPPQRFNDPFDMNPAIDVELSDEEWRVLHQLHAPDKLEQDFVQEMRANPSAFEADLKRHSDEMINSGFGASCFTAHENNPLMWGHYAERHKGVVIGYDAASGKMQKARRVDYQKDRQSLRLGKAFGMDDLRVKSDVWEWEDEWRLVARLDACTAKLRGETPIFVYTIRKEAVVSVKFGCRTPDDFKAALAANLRQWEYSRCQVSSMRMAEKTYELREEPYLLPMERAERGANASSGDAAEADKP